MFTGIVEEMGRIESIIGGGKTLKIRISATIVLEDVRIGDSIAVNGVCLTVTEHDGFRFTADVMPETFRSTSLADVKPGSMVNLERAMALGGRFGGHLVTGHIDGTGMVIGRKREENALWLDIKPPPPLMKYVINKGSICLDGTSLTISSLKDDFFSVSLIPHTAEATILSHKKNGDLINIECDVLAKYVERLMTTSVKEKKGMSLDWVIEQGF